MRTWVRKTLSVGVLAAGALLFAPGAAQAGTHQNSYDNNGILNGTQFVAPMNFPLNIVGNSDALLGHANAAGAGVNGRKAESANRHDHDRPNQDSSDNNGILNGTQIYAPVDMPINICGNSLALLLAEANSQAVCTNGGGRVHRESGWAISQDSSDNNGILNGTQIYAPFSMPINHCGNAHGILGAANAAAACANGVDGGHGHGTKGHGHGTKGHGDNGGDHGDNGGVKGDDGDYLGDHGHHGHGTAPDDNPGTGPSNGGVNGGVNDDGYGNGNKDDHTSTGGSTGGRSAVDEASPVDALTQGAGSSGLGGLDLLNTLR